MWLKTKDCLDKPYLINIDKYTGIFISYHEDDEPVAVNAYIQGVEDSYTTITRGIDQDVAEQLIKEIADAIDAGERLFDVDEFLALNKLWEAKK